jgi:hypothetical protein
MIDLTESAQRKSLRIAGYALAAAVITTTLFAAERAYRSSHDTTAPLANAEPSEQSAGLQQADTPPAQPVPQLQQALTPPAEPARPQTPGQDFATAQDLRGEPPIVAQPPLPAQGFTAQPPASLLPASPAARTASGPEDDDAAEIRKPQAKPKALPKAKPRHARQLPAKQATRTNAAPRRAAAAKPAKPATRAERPNVYFERESQLGFAPQLRSRICNPATGQMPMQCYYPREGRERFPAKSN